MAVNKGRVDSMVTIQNNDEDEEKILQLRCSMFQVETTFQNNQNPILFTSSIRNSCVLPQPQLVD
ncbi:uncharacterized protein Bfra_010616 [Botrytis fragariae]|uniref:Uncharacterized protein n=1 Tax=Botrytis fragariae TaxID=1964551 RepID=A0A8H6AGS2_9HELO|nr:uncharacterized protein Bfra_010616 [Botrytis fragariae]KAF5867641.1 hypothetical protein Bfra_010616 [Botrytis fragariae]